MFRQKPSAGDCGAKWECQAGVAMQLCAAGSQGSSLAFVISGILLVLVLQSSPEK